MRRGRIAQMGSTLMQLMAAGVLPVNLDFSTYDDGALPAILTGPTWTISGGKATNTPGGTELNTDVGLEGTYTAGKVAVLATTGGTTTQSADVHGGSKAQDWAPTANNQRIYLSGKNSTAGLWYRLLFWAKRVSGATGKTAQNALNTGSLPETSSQSFALTDASYTKHSMSWLSNAANTIFGGLLSTAAVADDVVIDDLSLQSLTEADLVAWLPATQADVTIKIVPETAYINDELFGLAVRSGDGTHTNIIYVLCYTYAAARTSYVRYAAIKKVGSTRANVISPGIVAIVDGAWFEVRLSGSTLGLYYNNSLLTSYTITDSELLSGTYHGMFNTGGQEIRRFFASAS